MSVGHLIVHDGGVIHLSDELLRDLGWRVGDDLRIDRTEGGMVIQRVDPEGT